MGGILAGEADGDEAGGERGFERLARGNLQLGGFGGAAGFQVVDSSRNFEMDVTNLWRDG
jgi:hypothetical protein